MNRKNHLETYISSQTINADVVIACIDAFAPKELNRDRETNTLRKTAIAFSQNYPKTAIAEKNTLRKTAIAILLIK